MKLPGGIDTISILVWLGVLFVLLVGGAASLRAPQLIGNNSISAQVSAVTLDL
jgi:hypothetical protein